MDDNDSAWKEYLDEDFKLAMEFFAPEVLAEMGHDPRYEVLETELRKMSPKGSTGKRIADKLIKLESPQGDERPVHFEVQGEPEDDFPERCFIYFYRDFDHFRLPPEMVIILTDSNAKWRPNTFEVQLKTVTLVFKFRPIKIMDWLGQEQHLREHPNPTGLFILAQLISTATKKDAQTRLEGKLDLILRLQKRNIQGDELRRWFRYLDWFLGLSPELERELWQRLQSHKETSNMAFLSYLDRRERDARNEGQRNGISQGIILGLDLKFGQSGLALMPQIEQITDSVLLQQIFDCIKTAKSVEDIRVLLPPSAGVEP
jgi:hypothetical protein